MGDVSVIVPVKNREKLVIRCLDSILNQTEKPRELIVVDNASTDSTYHNVEVWMKNHAESGIVFKLLQQEIPGAWATRQKGYENAESEWVIFFDSDDAMSPTLIGSAFDVIEKNEDVDLVCWKCRINLLNGTSKTPPFNPKNPVEGHLIHSILHTLGYMIKRDFLKKAGAWSKEVYEWDDLELGLRILLKQPRIKGINKILVDIYSQEDSITGKDFSTKEGKWEVTLGEMEREVTESNHPKKDRIQKILDYRRAILAAQYYKEDNKRGAANLLERTLKDKKLMEKIPLLFSYYYTRKGFRGAWRIVRYMI